VGDESRFRRVASAATSASRRFKTDVLTSSRPYGPIGLRRAEMFERVEDRSVAGSKRP
jgi:hypothetical protein